MNTQPWGPRVVIPFRHGKRALGAQGELADRLSDEGKSQCVNFKDRYLWDTLLRRLYDVEGMKNVEIVVLCLGKSDRISETADIVASGEVRVVLPDAGRLSKDTFNEAWPALLRGIQHYGALGDVVVVVGGNPVLSLVAKGLAQEQGIPFAGNESAPEGGGWCFDLKDGTATPLPTY